MIFGANRGLLDDVVKTARAKYDATTELWGDETRLRFEERVWAPTVQLAEQALRAVDRMTTESVQLRAECEFEPGF